MSNPLEPDFQRNALIGAFWGTMFTLCVIGLPVYMIFFWGN